MPALVRNIMGAGVAAGLANVLLGDVQDSMTAAGTSQSDAQNIGAAIARFTTVASGAGAILPAGSVGDELLIINAGANALSLYPPLGHAINAGATNAAFSIPTASSTGFKRISNLLWIALDASQLSFVQSGSGAVAEDVQTAIRNLGKGVKGFGATGDGVADDTAEIQAAHDAAVLAGYMVLRWPAGVYKVSAELEFSPFVTHIADGEVIITTAQASGRGMHISTEFGDRTTGLASGVRKQPVFIGPFKFVNTNASTTATGLYLGDIPASTTYGAHQIAFFGLQLVGWANQVDFATNAYIIDWHGCSFDGTGTSRAARALRVISTASAGAAGVYFFGCQFLNLAEAIDNQHATMAVDMHFIGCGFGANLQILADTANAGVFDFDACHLEINEYSPFASAPMFAPKTCTVNINGGLCFIGDASASYSSPVVGAVTTSGRLNVNGLKYTMAEDVGTLYTCDGTSTIILDDIPKHSVAPTAYVTVTAGGLLAKNGLRSVRGTFTPGLTFGGGSTGLTFSSRGGDYERVGDLVVWTATMTLSAKGSSTGSAKITGLPFAKGATSGVANPLSVAYYDTMTGLTSPPFGTMDNAATTASLFDGGATAAAALDEGNFNDTTTIQVGGSYFTDAD